MTFLYFEIYKLLSADIFTKTEITDKVYMLLYII